MIRRLATTGSRKYTAGNIDRRKNQRLVALGWLTEASVNISDVLYEVTDAGKAAALRGNSDGEAITSRSCSVNDDELWHHKCCCRDKLLVRFGFKLVN